MTFEHLSLADLGWRPSFQTELLELNAVGLAPARVMAVHRDQLHVAGSGLDRLIPWLHASDEEGAATVGDWLLIDPVSGMPHRLLGRTSLFKRRSAGTGRRVQLIAANIDTLFIVSSCNQDFNLARLERYLALAREAEVMPLVILTKSDLTDQPADWARRASALMPGLLVDYLDARDPAQVARLADWCRPGQTVALLGSSGVGKSTLVNSLTGRVQLATQDVRAGDDKGRHTTTGRTLHRLPAGGWLLDTPGMRELQLADTRAGLDSLFADIVSCARQCRYADCGHNGEPGCAITAAIEAGELEEERIRRWRKLMAEEAHNREALHERRAREKQFGRAARQVFKRKAQRWDQ